MIAIGDLDVIFPSGKDFVSTTIIPGFAFTLGKNFVYYYCGILECGLMIKRVRLFKQGVFLRKRFIDVDKPTNTSCVATYTPAMWSVLR